MEIAKPTRLDRAPGSVVFGVEIQKKPASTVVAQRMQRTILIEGGKRRRWVTNTKYGRTLPYRPHSGILRRMADYLTTIAQGQKQGVTPEQEKQMGTAATAPMDEKHNVFLQTILQMIDSGTIDVYKPETFLKKDIYDKLEEQWRDKTDLALINIANHLQNIYLFRVSKQTPDTSPILAAMIDELWQMKQRIEDTHDVFIF